MKERLRIKIIVYLLFLVIFFLLPSFAHNPSYFLSTKETDFFSPAEIYLGSYDKERERAVKKTLRRWERINRFLEVWERKIEESKDLDLAKLTPPQKKEIKKKEQLKVLYLTQELWELRPRPEIEIEIGRSLIIQGRGIARYLVEREDLLEIERIDIDRIRLSAKNIGPSFLHIWDEKGRWTFRVKVVPPRIIVPPKEVVVVWRKEPFKFFYNVDWHSYYKNPREASLNLGELERTYLGFWQYLGFWGPTPYGDVDGSLRTAKYEEGNKITGYTLGWTSARIGRLKDFNVRIFDFYKSFSRFSLPGVNLRGGLLEGKAFSHNLEYALLWGEEEEVYYGYLTPGIREKKKSYIEGIRLSLFPQDNFHYAFNYSQGYGLGREGYLPQEVFSWEGAWYKEGRSLDWEIGFDGDSFACVLNSDFSLADLSLNASLRNIEKNFSTIVGWPADRGEIGMEVGANWSFQENINISSYLDIYRARYLYNEGKPERLNYNWDTNISFNLDRDSSLRTFFSYINEGGLSFPRRYFHSQTTYSRTIKLWGNNFTSSVGMDFSRSRNALSPSSDYDSYRSLLGFRYFPTPNLRLYLNYEYGWLEEKLSGEKGNPSAFEVGLDCEKELFPSLSIDTSLKYRNEEETELTHAFLAGEDSLEGSLRLEFKPRSETQIFVEGRLREVWEDFHDREDYTEAHLRWGVKTTWNTFFRWDPQGIIRGEVFEDINGDGKRQEGEPGLKGIKIEVGEKEVITGKEGRFQVKIRAEKVLVRIDEDSLPQGYILTTPPFYKTEIVEGEDIFINFGASCFSLIYGTVFYDTNSNQRFDAQDIPLPYVRILLGERSTFTNLQGSYYFRNLQEGTYHLRLDINTLPVEYLPTVPLEKEIYLSKGIKYLSSFPLRKK